MLYGGFGITRMALKDCRLTWVNAFWYRAPPARLFTGEARGRIRLPLGGLLNCEAFSELLRCWGGRERDTSSWWPTVIKLVV